MTEQVLRNARIVMRGEVVHGDLLMRDGEIAAVDSTGFGDIGTDLEGDFLLPGLVELHTDHLESHYAPRPGVRWNAMSAVQAHDAQIAASGITTVFDALRVGMDEDARISSRTCGSWRIRSGPPRRPAGFAPSTSYTCVARSPLPMPLTASCCLRRTQGFGWRR
jgi:cytosine/adenosine deaminase-related metal-dependent hydrolase